jgi:TonB-dependent receptor
MKKLLLVGLLLPTVLLSQTSVKDTIQKVKEITVVRTVNKESTTELVRLQRTNISSVDGINAETFRRTPDSKVSDVFKRVTGISVVDNRFVVVRGLNDRYNFALLNGLPLPSSESDKRAFSFDIFPSNMVDNLLVIKTANADLPGEFAGGLIDINTSEPKDKLVNSIQLGTSYNRITTFKNFRTYDGGNSREMPNLPSTIDFSTLSRDDKSNLAKLMDFTWSTKNKIALPNTSFSYTLSNKIKFENKSVFGFLLTYNYQNNLSFNKVVRREFEEQATGVVLKMELNDSLFTQNILNSGMLNFSYNKNKTTIRFKNIYSFNSEDKLNVRKGVRELDNDPRQWEKSTNFWYTENKFYTNQLLGTHKLDKLNIDWGVGYSNVKRNIPNLRRIVYRKYSYFEDDTTEQYVAVIQQNGTIPTAAGNMFWSTSNENMFSGRYDFKYKINDNINIKFGGWNQLRTKNFDSRNFGFSQYKPTGSSFNSNLLLLPETEIFSVENMGLLENGRGGFKLDEATNVDDSYNAQSFLNTGYILGDLKFGKLKTVGGIRVESYNQKFNYIEFGSNLDKTIDTTVIDFLPSLNIIYDITPKFRFRTAFSQTVSRPEFRELAPFNFYNFVQDNIISGNPELLRTKITNGDLRFEWYGGKGQIITVSGFYKNFVNPIEIINRTGTSGAPELYFSNISRATSIGTELEFRLLMSTLIDKKVFEDLTIYSNLSLIKSTVHMDEVIGSGGNRPLQGQSPYIINSGIFYSTDNINITLSYNVIGPRIYIVGNTQEPSVWEQGRNLIDFQLSKTIKDFEIKLNIKDVLAQKLLYFQDLNGNQKYSEGDNRWQETSFGQSVSLTLKYNFSKIK